MNAKTREKLLYIGFFVQKLVDIIDDEREPSKTLQTLLNGNKPFIDGVIRDV